LLVAVGRIHYEAVKPDILQNKAITIKGHRENRRSVRVHEGRATFDRHHHPHGQSGMYVCLAPLPVIADGYM
jgi:hypothetical protein